MCWSRTLCDSQSELQERIRGSVMDTSLEDLCDAHSEDLLNNEGNQDVICGWWNDWLKPIGRNDKRYNLTFCQVLLDVFLCAGAGGTYSQNEGQRDVSFYQLEKPWTSSDNTWFAISFGLLVGYTYSQKSEVQPCILPSILPIFKSVTCIVLIACFYLIAVVIRSWPV